MELIASTDVALVSEWWCDLCRAAIRVSKKEVCNKTFVSLLFKFIRFSFASLRCSLGNIF